MTPTSEDLLNNEFVRDYTARFNRVAQEIPNFSENNSSKCKFYNTTFSRKLANKEPSDVDALLSPIKIFIQGGDYVRCKRELENEVTESQSSKKSKHVDNKPRVSV